MLLTVVSGSNAAQIQIFFCRTVSSALREPGGQVQGPGPAQGLGQGLGQGPVSEATCC